MLFRLVPAILTGPLLFVAQGALGAPHAPAALTSAQVVRNIQIVTTTSRGLNTSFSGLQTVQTVQSATTFSQTVVLQFQTIISNLSADVTAMQATPAFNDADAGPIVDALKTFVAVHQALLATVIGKHSIFAQYAVTAPITAVLRSLEAGIDAFALAMINLIPTRTSDVQADKTALDGSVGTTISTYNQACIPSILYPLLLPVCVG